MRILYVQDTDWIRRNPIQHNHLAERMVLRGHKIKVIDYEILWREEGKRKLISKRRSYKVSRLLKNAIHEVIRPPILKLPLLDYFSMIFSYTKEILYQFKIFKPDILIGDGILSPFLAFKLARKLDIKTVYYCIDVNYKLIPYKILQPFGKILERFNMKNTDLVLSINEVLREYTISMGVISNKTKVIGAGVDFKQFNSNLMGTQIRKKYGIVDNDILLIFIGWLYHFSGLKEVIFSMKNFNKKNIKLLIIGDGDAYQDIFLLRKKYNLEDRIIMVGRKTYEKIPEYLAAADICILPAYNNEIMRYIVPIKIYEYMAMQKPVICTKLPGIYKEFGVGNGIIYVNKPEDTISCIIKLINEKKIKKEGKKARKFVEDNNWEQIANKFENVLNSL